jgi:hypothetical protein
MRKTAAVTAVTLLGRWTQLAGRHIPMGAGCSCGPGFASLQLHDFEQQLLDYLRAKHGDLVGDSMVELLRKLSKEQPPQAKALLQDLGRSLDSFDELHRISPGAGSAPP